MIIAFIGLGSNLGDGKRTLQSAWQELGRVEGLTLQKLSSPYLSEPVGMESDNWFTNAVGKVETTLTAEDLLDSLLNTEKSFGRRRDPQVEGYQDRTLDLDLIYFGDEIVRTRRLHLPHPQLFNRLFVLDPLNEIASDFVCPEKKKNVQQILQDLHKGMKNGDLPEQEITKSSWE